MNSSVNAIVNAAGENFSVVEIVSLMCRSASQAHLALSLRTHKFESGERTDFGTVAWSMRPPKPIDDILMTCLEFDMFKRYRKAAELKDALQLARVGQT